MKKFTLLAAAALSLVVVGTSVVAAQDTTKKESKGEVVKAPTTATLIAAIEGSAVTGAKLGSFKVESGDKVQVVDVLALITSPSDEEAIKAAIDKNKDGIKMIRDELKKHNLVVQALDGSARKPETGDVVGVEVQEGDRVVVYFWKK